MPPRSQQRVKRYAATRRRLVVADVADRFGLRQGLDLETATDLFVLLCGTEVYLTLQRSGWHEDKYVAWLTDTLARQLLARPGLASDGFGDRADTGSRWHMRSR